MINSTVLKAALTKLDASGNKDLTYAPSNGLTVLIQGKDQNGNPTFGGNATDATGLQKGGLAVDPFGARVRNVQPPDSTQQMANMHVFGPPDYGATWSTFTDANNFSSGCTLDGVRTRCTSILQALSQGMATEKPGTTSTGLNLLGFGAITYRTTRLIPPKGYEELSSTETTVWTEYVPLFGVDGADPPPSEPPNRFKDENADCSIEVRFKGSLSPGAPQFDDGPDHTKLGSYVGQWNGFTEFKFRFEVIGSVNDGVVSVPKLGPAVSRERVQYEC